MQVATLFRETANLLGASMESTSSNGGSNGSCSPTNGLNSNTQTHHNRDQVYTRPLDRYKPLTSENQDDGYETSADMVLTNGLNSTNNMDHMDDPYSFVDDERNEPVHNHNGSMHLQQIQHNHNYMTPPHPQNNILQMAPNSMIPVPRKRGRKKKMKMEEEGNMTTVITKMKVPGKERKKHDRFNGMPEEEVSKRTLPDHLTQNLDIIIVGINPGLFAAYKGHHYAGPGNHFWKCLYLAGLTPEQMTAEEDYKLLQVGIGFTNMVQRATKGSADLTRKEIKEGSQILLEKLQHYKPKIAVFNGKLIYEVFSGKKDFCFGRQPELIDGTNTYMWVMPSSSARCAQLPRAADKVPFYSALKKFRDYLNGMVAIIDESEVVFSEARIKSSFDSEMRSQNSNDITDISKSEDGDNTPSLKKKRGRPKKVKLEGDELLNVNQPKPQNVIKRTYTNNLNADGTKKKRGRPKKIRDGNTDFSVPVDNYMNEMDQMEQSPAPTPIEYNQNHNDYTRMYNTPTSTPSQPIQHLPSYIQSPRPQSQPFTHSDLSSEISAAISSSEHLESPAPTSPSLDAPDFDPPTMPAEDTTTECCFSSPTPSITSDQQTTPPMIRPLPYSAYNNYSPDPNNVPIHKQEYKVQDMSTKSLSGLESLVDQIPNITDNETSSTQATSSAQATPPTSHQSYQSLDSATPTSNIGLLSSVHSPTTGPPSSNFNYPTNLSPLTFPTNYPTSNYSPHLMGGIHPFMEHHNCGMPAVPVPLSYHQLPPPYGQQYSPSYHHHHHHHHQEGLLHMPSPNYPNGYSYSSGYGSQPAVPVPTPVGPGYHHMFDRLKPDSGGYGSF